MNSSQVSAEGTLDVKIQFILRSNKKVAPRQIMGTYHLPILYNLSRIFACSKICFVLLLQSAGVERLADLLEFLIFDV